MLPNSESCRNGRRPYRSAAFAQSSEVRNCAKKKTAETMPAQKPTSPSPPTCMPSSMKKRKGPATPAEQNSPNMSRHTTAYGSQGMGVSPVRTRMLRIRLGTADTWRVLRSVSGGPASAWK